METYLGELVQQKQNAKRYQDRRSHQAAGPAPGTLTPRIRNVSVPHASQLPLNNRLYAIQMPTPIRTTAQNLCKWKLLKLPSRNITPSAVNTMAPIGALLAGGASAGGGATFGAVATAVAGALVVSGEAGGGCVSCQPTTFSSPTR